MKVRLGLSNSGLDRIAFVYRQGYTGGDYGEWLPVVRFRTGLKAPTEFEISDEATKREIAAANLAVSCETFRSGWESWKLAQQRAGAA